MSLTRNFIRSIDRLEWINEKGRVEQISHAVDPRFSFDITKSFFFFLTSLDIGLEEMVSGICRSDAWAQTDKMLHEW